MYEVDVVGLGQLLSSELAQLSFQVSIYTAWFRRVKESLILDAWLAPDPTINVNHPILQCDMVQNGAVPCQRLFMNPWMPIWTST